MHPQKSPVHPQKTLNCESHIHSLDTNYTLTRATFDVSKHTKDKIHPEKSPIHPQKSPVHPQNTLYYGSQTFSVDTIYTLSCPTFDVSRHTKDKIHLEMSPVNPHKARIIRKRAPYYEFTPVVLVWNPDARHF